MSLVNQVLKDLENTSTQSSNMKFQAVKSEGNSWFRTQSSLVVVFLLITTLAAISYIIWSQPKSVTDNADLTTKPSQNIQTSTAFKNTESQAEERYSEVKANSSLESNTQAKNVDKEDSLKIVSNNKPVNLKESNIEDNSIVEKKAKVSKKDTQSTTQIIEPSKRVQTKSSTVNTINKNKLADVENSSQVKVSSNRTLLKKELNQITKEQQVFGIEHTLQRLQDFVSVNPSYDQARLQLIKLSWSKQRQRLDSILNDSIKASPNQSAFYIAAARYYLEENKQKKALDIINQYKNLHRSAELLKFRALIQQKLGNHKDAVMDYQKVIKLSSASDSIYLALGISLEAIGELEHAKNSYRKALSGRSLSNQQIQFVENKLHSLQG